MPAEAVEKLLKKLRGRDYRAAYRAVGQLRFPHDASLVESVASYKPKDEQRRFQFELARIALGEGIRGLTKQWLRLGTDEQRRTLLQEISSREWGEWALEIAIAALEEPDDNVRGYAVLCARDAAQRGSISPEQRARVTQGLVRAMARHDERPLGLFWLEKYVELLGLTGDASVLERLEKLRSVAGASRRTTLEKLDPENMPVPYPKNAADFPPGVPVPVARVWDRGTGLLEIKILETALKRIRSRP